jgi:hypothetical protein
MTSLRYLDGREQSWETLHRRNEAWWMLLDLERQIAGMTSESKQTRRNALIAWRDLLRSVVNDRSTGAGGEWTQ